MSTLKNNRFQKPQHAKHPPINEHIQATTVRVVQDSGEMEGVMNIENAISLARSHHLDLVMISPDATPPVCRIMDYGKYRYAQQKKQQKIKQKQKVMAIKEIQLRPKIETHDLLVKTNKVKEFIANGYKVKIVVRFRGRELQYKEQGLLVLKKVIEEVGENNIRFDVPIKDEFRYIMAVISPKATI